jgi:AraC-like DNA-binding protein
LAVDCCEHTLAALGGLTAARLTAVTSEGGARVAGRVDSVDLIVIGASQFPVRRPFISHLRRVYPEAPVLVLRREAVPRDKGEERVRGEFILSDRAHRGDLGLVRALRRLLPLAPCKHLHRSHNYDMVREVVRLVAENFADPDLSLRSVARRLPASPSKLSYVLNRQVGVSFRQLLRQVRIEEAKHMLSSHKYSVKEVAARVGFSDSHYFSRSFKAVTGMSATEFVWGAQDFALAR